MKKVACAAWDKFNKKGFLWMDRSTKSKGGRGKYDRNQTVLRKAERAKKEIGCNVKIREKSSPNVSVRARARLKRKVSYLRGWKIKTGREKVKSAGPPEGHCRSDSWGSSRSKRQDWLARGEGGGVQEGKAVSLKN